MEHQLPFLRRYARAVTGHAAQGDRAVERMLETLVDAAPAQVTRVSLFAALDKALVPGGETGSALARRALLLTAMEGFSLPDAAAVLGAAPQDLAGLLEDAERGHASAESRRICIIEDELLIGASLSQIAAALGHTVTGVTSTAADAVLHALTVKPDLLIADIHLADGSQGTEAVAEIRRSLPIPAIFITAFPERLLTGRPGEPTFLIPKPFKPAHVRAVITQALSFRPAAQ
ncbi:response regulator [Hyphomonas sp.]|uniref:response regulator n=1 Tax=Hyphomonas sp. TaxID=87 RepID=UPI0025BDC782|nr:response regulator [Hyphomonas sp.]